MHFPGGSVVKNLPANVEVKRDTAWIPESGRSPGVGNGNLIQDSCLKNLIDRGLWQATVHGVAEWGITEQLHIDTCIKKNKTLSATPII